MLAALHVTLQLAIGIALPILIIRYDLTRLCPEALARCWNDASLWSAVVAFGPLALLVHFARSRRSLIGVLLGLGWAALMIAVSLVFALVFDFLEA